MDYLTTLYTLKGKHALVTGGGSGIGKTLAIALAQAGANITIVGRRQQPINDTVQAIQIANPTVQSYAVSANIADLNGIPSLVEKINQKMGNIDIVINNAGNNPRLPIEQLTPQIWQTSMDVNLSAAFFLAQAVAPQMKANKWGRIVNLASLQSSLAFKNGSVYGAAKSGISQLTRGMAREWSDNGININAIAPGFFPTELTAPVLHNSPEGAADLANRTAIGRNGELHELVGTVILLCSDASSFITGQTWYIDGGFTAV